jgi:hypothetical protein
MTMTKTTNGNRTGENQKAAIPHITPKTGM